MCKGELTDKRTAFMVELDGAIVIVKNVPSQVCDQCGEVSYSDKVSARLEELVNAARSAVTEISVIHYADTAA
jgi:YgiT-type zinc finger domain-containing protein